MLVRNKATKTEGQSSSFNNAAYAEIIVYFLDGDCSSEPVACYDVYLKSSGTWVDMADALAQNLIIPDQYDIQFREPADEQEKQRGWYY